MKRSYSIAEIKRADERAIEGGTPSSELMARAGKALAARAGEIMREKKIGDVLFVCGGGNNGGDGFVAAQILYEAGKDVAVLCLSKRFTPECAAAASRYKGVLLGRIPRRRFALLVDCVMGSGLKNAPEGDAAALIGFLASCGGYVLSCDLPSGLSENGIALSPCVRADETLAIGGLKHALLLADGADMAGRVSVADIGLSPEGGAEICEEADIARLFPARKSNSHKGTYGTAVICAAGAVSTGAIFLAAKACLRSGVGYAKLFAEEPFFSQAVGKLPALVLRNSIAPDGEMLAADCILIGMGAGVSGKLYAFLAELIPKYTGVLVLDADALNTLARFGTEILKNKACRVVITPHPAEFARLTGKTAREVTADAVALAAGFAREYGVTVVLKNNRTVIAGGTKLAINPTGSPALAKGGSGDVLAGFLAGTCGRGVPPYEAACAACYLLGKAGEIAAEEMGEYAPDADDIVGFLPKAMKFVSP